MALGKPGIPNVRVLDVRSVQGAVDALRRRTEAIEALLEIVNSIALTSANRNLTTNATLSSLQSQITQIQQELDELTDLLAQDDGLVVLTDGNLLTRTLAAGSGISITNADGADGNPTIAAISECCYPFLTTELDDDILTEDGHRIRVE